ncbi:hypothetical protein BUALT_Bualt01G0189900 [Buddleja alternifolia]|uniref:BED-type domain-containing protein n=1 Tax=Buddleja alternifolia TaxID=168488 RepID=A0AAV6Y9Y0_9LAMI|nr:hypothetical protein BUALT_Bualt01G0189900 [Buddleja alternifolia]
MNIGTPGDTSSHPTPAVEDSTSPTFCSREQTSERTMDCVDPIINEEVDDIENTNTIATNDDVQKAKRAKTSQVWKHIEESKGQDGSIQLFCKHCKHVFKKPSTGATSHLGRHLRSCSVKLRADALEEREILTQSRISFPTSIVDPLSVPAFDGKFDMEKVKVDIAKWIMIHEYAFSTVEDEWFNVMMKRTNSLWMPISRTTIRNQCVKIYESEKKMLKNEFKYVNKMSITTDCWKSKNQKVEYLVITGIGLIKIGAYKSGVDYLRRSDSRLKIFTEIVKQLNLRERKLIDDCKTRWNSTYEMLAVAIKFKDVFPRYADRDPLYVDCPSPSDWEKVVKVCSLLEVFWKATHVISGSYYPISNLFLQEVVRVKVELDSKSQSSDDFIYDMVDSMKHKFDKYWGESNLLMAIAAVLDPRYKMMALEFFFLKLYSSEKAATELAFVRRTFTESNASGEGSSSCQSSGDDRNVETGTLWSELASFLKEKQSVQPQKSELDMYLEENCFIETKNSKDGTGFDVLDWWKIHALKYKVLSTFSAGSRVIDKYRVKLSAESVELLMCGSDWLRKRHGIKKKSEAKFYIHFN